MVLLTLALGAALAALVALAGTARQAEATFPGTNGKIVFVSDRTTGTGVDNPTGDNEIFTKDPDGTGLKQLTFNTTDEYYPVFSPDGKKIAYNSQGDSASNPQREWEIYMMNALDGSGKMNLTNNGTYVEDFEPVFSPDGTRIAYESRGTQTSNPGGELEVYVMNATDGSGQINLSNTGGDVYDYSPAFSPDGTKIAYQSYGVQTSNPEGDEEIYRVNALDGTVQINLTNNGAGVRDRFPVFSSGGGKIAYESGGIQTSNSQGDAEVYVMNSADGSGKKNLSNTIGRVDDYDPAFSQSGKKIAYVSRGAQTSNAQGDPEVYLMNTLDGTGRKNLTNNGVDVEDFGPVFSPDGTKIVYTTHGIQTSNPQGDPEIYRMNALDGSGKLNHSNTGSGVSDDSPDWGVLAM